MKQDRSSVLRTAVMTCAAGILLASGIAPAQRAGAQATTRRADASTLPPAHAPADPVWPALSRENKPWTRWWWLGSAVDKPNLTRELEAIAAAGFGGVEITPIYGEKGADSRNIEFLSDPYVAMLAFTCSEARRLGLGVDMATGTGWPFGGPNVTPADAELKVGFADGKLVIEPTGFQVKRAAPGGAGPVVNPFSPTAMQHYLRRFDPMIDALGPGAFRSQFHDSFEYKANWSNEVPEKFLAMHGYDLRDHVAELSGKGDPDTVARVKADYRSTMAELHLEYIRTWVEWAHSHNELAREQAHGAPGNLLDLYAAADIAETELFGAQKYPIPGFRRDADDIAPDPQSPLVHRLASSASHVTGHPLASSETFTWLREHFRVAPSEMKPEVDQLFVTGINHIFYHGTAYSPADAPWPGWLFYASTQANPRNPLWNEFAALNGYIGRCQAELQAGRPDNDVLLYWPVDDLWHTDKGLTRGLSMHRHDWLAPTPAGRLASELVTGGYAFDFVSDEQVLQTQFVDGSLKTAGGVAYRTLLVPPVGHMSPATLQHCLDLAEQGATVLFADSLPADVPGFGKLAEHRAQLKAQLDLIKWEPGETTAIRSARIGRGRVLMGHSPDALLTAVHASREPIAGMGLGVIRRRLRGGYVYFIANLSGKPAEGWVKLGRPAQSVTLLDPLTERSGLAALRQDGGAAEVFIQLRPGESRLLKTSDTAQNAGEPWRYYVQSGQPVALSGEWSLRFLSGGPEIPAPRQVAMLGSWADAPDAAAQNFGGTARYEIAFDLPPDAKADAWELDLGDVRETARVSLNGEPAGHVWSLPFETVLTAPPKLGKNILTLDVTNTAANRIRDLDRRGVQWKNGKNFVNIRYKPFNAADWPLQPSGLLGPVKLVPLRVVQPAAPGGARGEQK